MALLLATLFGVFGCTGAGNLATEDGYTPAENDQLISANNGGLASDSKTEKPQNLMNLAATEKNANGVEVAKFQIVYSIAAGDAVKDQCEAVSQAIYDVTGVKIPVVHNSQGKKTYEITVGQVKREETLDKIDGFGHMKNTDFAISVVDTRVVIYAVTSQALATALEYFMNSVAYTDEEEGIYGIASDYDLYYHPNEIPPVSILGTDEHYVELQLENGTSMFTYVRLSYTGNSGWRIQTRISVLDEYKDRGAAQLLSYSMGEEDPSVLGTITTASSENKLTVTGEDGSRVEILTDVFTMNFYTPNGKLASTVNNITANAGGATISGTLLEDEAIFGTGERFDSANQRGKYIDMFSKDIWSQSSACYMVIPLLCSSRGSGLFVNVYEYMTMDLGKADHDTWQIAVSKTMMDCYIYTTEKMTDVITAYSDLTGYAEMPEEWTYGMIVCAYGPDLSQKWTVNITPSADGRGEGVYEMIANMEAYDLPWTGVLAEAWGAYSEGKHDDLKELCDYVHSLGKKFLVYMAVGTLSSSMSHFSPNYYLYQQQGKDKTYQIPQTGANAENPDVGNSAGGTRVYLDITNPDAVEWFFNDYWDYLCNEIGVDGCKIDFCEQIPENYELLYYDENIPTSGSHHWYPTAFCAKFWDMLSQKPDSGMCYTRGGGIGSQRAPYMWAGDQERKYDALSWQLTALLSSGLSGVPFMSYDMSGYQYGRASQDVEYEAQVFIRGTQFSAYTICLQTHGKVRRSYQFARDGAEYATDIYRAYTKLHEHLTPYITELTEEACTTGIPVMRHLVLHYQNDKNVYNIEDEFLMGDAFLVAPILDDKYQRDIYLPEGTWKDLNTGVVYTVGAEGKWLRGYEANLAQLPTFYNVNTESEIAPSLVDGILDLYAYAETLAP